LQIAGSNISDDTSINECVKRLQLPLIVFKPDDGVDYFTDFLDQIDLPLVHMDGVESIPGPKWCIRHDVDHSLDLALAI